MSPLMRAIALGLALGLGHALDADHVVAVSTIVARTRSVPQATWLGVLWGLGHSVTVLAVGAMIVLLELHLPATLTAGVDLVVAAMLVTLGVQGLRAERRHRHRDGRDHRHGSDHRATHREDRDRSAASWPRALCVGTVHGLAGSAGVSLLALSTVEGRVPAAGFLVVFSAGIVIGMAILTGVVSLFLNWGARYAEALGRNLRRSVALLSVLLGIALAVEALYPADAGADATPARSLELPA